jgi:hypothetical protein
MNDLFRNFLDGVSARGGYCLETFRSDLSS